MDILKYFSSATFRKFQKETLKEIDNEIEKGTKVIIYRAPTGSGKSIVCSALCRKYTGFYTTPLLMLIDQIENDKYISKFFKTIKGRKNYPCNDGADSAANGKCVIEEMLNRTEYSDMSCKSDCSYYKAKSEAEASDCILASLSYLSVIKQDFGRRKLLIVDEAHELANTLFRLVEFKIPLGSSPIPRNYIELVQLLTERVSICKKLITENTHIPEYVDKLSKKIALYELFINNYNDYVFDIRRDEIALDYDIIIRTTNICNYAQNLWKKANCYLITSATIINPERLIKLTGLPIDFKLLDIPSCFPAENRRIVMSINGLLGGINIYNKDIYLPKLTKKIGKIMDLHRNERGFIHCHTYEIMKYIYEHIAPDFKYRLLFHTSATRDLVLKEFINSKDNKIMLSVNMIEGLDLSDDKCRFMIFCKAMYDNLHDSWVKKMIELYGKDWYEEEALMRIIQAMGRDIRSETDYSTAYILDENIIKLIERNRKKLPKYFEEIWNLKTELKL